MSERGGKQWHNTGGGGGGAVYGLGLIGALIYYFHVAVGFGAFVTAILKSLVWPAYMVYHLFQFLRM